MARMIDVNATRFHPRDAKGHYESFFLRANHPTRALAFWIRYTVFCPKGQPGKAIGELWAVVANGETGRHVAVKKEMPMSQCRFDRGKLAVQIGDAMLDAKQLRGAAAGGGHRVGWSLAYEGSEAPVLFLPQRLYDASFPKAKSVVSLPMATFNGVIQLDGESITVDNWVGSQNHNWGVKHTDRYAYGQVCGFDNAPASFLEIATAKVKIGPLWTPAMTLMVLRHDGREIALNGVWRSLRAKGEYEYFRWGFSSENGDAAIAGEISAAREDFVGLRYYNPPGGEKTCLNSKIASCTLTLRDKRSGASTELIARRRAAFEILTDDDAHGVEIKA